MPRVPLYDRLVQTQSAKVNTQESVHPPAAAFGVGTSGDPVAEVLGRVGEMVAQRATELQQREDDKSVLLNDVGFRQEVQKILTDDTESGGRPNGFLNRKLYQAKDATKEFDAAVAPIREKYLKNMVSASQKNVLTNRMDNHVLAARETVIRHEVTERENDFRNVLNANVEQSVKDAALISDPIVLQKSIATAQQATRVGLYHLGLDKTSIDLANQKLAGDMLKSSIGAIVETDHVAAQKLLDAHKGAIPPPMVAEIQSVIDGKALADERTGAWVRVSGAAFRLPDGTFDTEKQRVAIMALPGVPTERKEKIFDYVQSRAAEARTALNQAHAASDRQFMNDLYTLRKSGGSLDEALKLAGGSGYDQYDQAIKEKAVRDLYDTPKDSQPGIYIALWEGVQNKTVDQRSIDTAFDRGHISVADWEQLRKDYYKAMTEGVSPAEKEMKERVRILSLEKFGSNKTKRDQFEYAVQLAGRGKPAAEQWKVATDMLKDVDVPWSWLDKPAYQAVLKQNDAQNIVWGQLYEDIGRVELDSIGQGMLLTGKPDWGIRDVAAFAENFGGPAKIVRGTPAHNAIQSLLQHGEMVTVENVKAVLKSHPDGHY